MSKVKQIHPGARWPYRGVWLALILLLTACPQPAQWLDEDQDGKNDLDASEDCDPRNATVYRGAPEKCDGVDNNCDGVKDEASAVDAPTWYADTDQDGYGDAAATARSCLAPAGYVGSSSDCSDVDNTIYPGAFEACDEVDSDCDGDLDDDLVETWYPDVDNDGYGDPAGAVDTCAPDAGYIRRGQDCDDGDSSRFPGNSELCDGKDNNCDGVGDPLFKYYVDRDADGFGVYEESCTAPSSGSTVLTRGDCDDVNGQVHPGAADSAGDGVDQDCGGVDGPQPHVGFGQNGSLSSVQAALDAAPTTGGITIWVGPGRYRERDVTFGGKPVKLMSTHFSTQTSLDGENFGRVMIFNSGETPDSVVDGFTITRGRLTSNSGCGGVMLIEGASPRFLNSVISAGQAKQGGGLCIRNMGVEAPPVLIESSVVVGCVAYNYGQYPSGGGLYLLSARVQMTGVQLWENSAAEFGGAIYSDESRLELDHVFILANTATDEGGGIYSAGGTLSISQSNIHQNISTQQGAGGIFNSGTPTTYTNSIVADNAPYNLYSVGGATDQVFRATDFYQAGGGMGLNFECTDCLNLDPQLVYPVLDDLSLSNFHLSRSSALIDLGFSDGSSSALDADGSPPDLGIFGGALGARWDYDQDLIPDYFWPGSFADAPSAVADPSTFDCDDRDPDNKCR